MYACNKTSNYDTAQDPLAGLENMNFIQLMTSKRYKKRLESQMFWEMFRYIQGVNEVNYQIDMNFEAATMLSEPRTDRDDHSCCDCT